MFHWVIFKPSCFWAICSFNCLSLTYLYGTKSLPSAGSCNTYRKWPSSLFQYNFIRLTIPGVLTNTILLSKIDNYLVYYFCSPIPTAIDIPINSQLHTSSFTSKDSVITSLPLLRENSVPVYPGLIWGQLLQSNIQVHNQKPHPHVTTPTHQW